MDRFCGRRTQYERNRTEYIQFKCRNCIFLATHCWRRQDKDNNGIESNSGHTQMDYVFSKGHKSNNKYRGSSYCLLSSCFIYTKRIINYNYKLCLKVRNKQNNRGVNVITGDKSPRPINSHLTYILTQYEVPHDRGLMPLSRYFFFAFM